MSQGTPNRSGPDQSGPVRSTAVRSNAIRSNAVRSTAKRNPLELLLLLLALAAPALALLDAVPDWPWASLALLFLLLGWLFVRPPLREVALTGGAILTAALILGHGWMQQRRPSLSEAEWASQVRGGYAQIWQRLQARAEQGRGLLCAPDDPESGDRGEVFACLGLLADELEPRSALLLLEPDGETYAWAGEGVLHDLEQRPLPPSGVTYRVSFGAVTVLYVLPLSEERRPWRLVAGRTFPADQLPFANPGRGSPRDFSWTLTDDPQDLPADVRLVRLQGHPTLVAWPNRGAGAAGSEPLAGTLLQRPELRLAWFVLGFGLLALAVMRGVVLAVPDDLPSTRNDGERRPRVENVRLSRPWRSLSVAACGLGGAAAWSLAATTSVSVTLALAGGGLLAALGLRGYNRSGRFLPVTFKGLAAALLLLVCAWWLQAYFGPLDLASELFATPVAVVLRVALAAAACGLFLLAGREGQDVPEAGDGWAWLCTGLLAGAAAFHDSWLLAAGLLAGAGVCLAVWADPWRVAHRASSLTAMVLLGSLAGATAWEISYRYHLRATLQDDLLYRLRPLSQQEEDDLAGDLARYFDRRDLADMVPVDPKQLEHQDLAFRIWRRSPLARHNALSAVVVRPHRGPPSAFSYGLSLRRFRQAELPPELASRRQPAWEARHIEAVSELQFRGESWGTLTYWLWPQPGFLLGTLQQADEIDQGLLTRGVAGGNLVEGLPQPVFYSLYNREGRALLTPWEEAPPLPGDMIDSAQPEPSPRVVDTPVGNAWAFRRLRSDGWEVLYLPVLNPLAALDRAGTHALGVLALFAVGSLFTLLLALPRAPFRDLLRRTLRSYSKRLLLVYSLLLLIPLPLLNVTLVTGMEERLWRQQRLEGEAALSAARYYINDALFNLPPGFGIDTSFDDRLRELASIVQHDVHLYYGGANVTASSRRDLFTAGLLPKRIPGEIFSRLVLGDYIQLSRTNVVGDLRYVELYAPLRDPDRPAGQERLFLSMPLLAQQKEVTRELTQMRRQALLVTAALFAVMVALSIRLARRFTEPLEELVEGTRKIAAGAPSLDLQPRELELAELVEAVDDMARKIDHGRRQLLHEKQVVERMVDNITSGVVSLDLDQRVVMHNRVAGQLLGVKVGDRLEDLLERRPRLAPIGDLMRRPGDEPRRVTVHLPPPEAAAHEASAHELGDAGSLEQEWSVVWVPIPGSDAPSALLVVEDVTEVLRGQRLQAWAEMARIIAHEIKNPLTPIRLSTEHMQLVHKGDPEAFPAVFERCTANILRQVDELREIATEFSTYSKIPRIDPQFGDLAELVSGLVDGYRAAPPPGVTVYLDLSDVEVGGVTSVPARFDARVLARAVRNLLENAVRASAGGGDVRVSLHRVPAPETEGAEPRDFCRIVVTDTGPGVDPDHLGRIFDPYFSTHDSGTGLGLPIARRIVEEHGGTIVARNREQGGLEVTITVPITDA